MSVENESPGSAEENLESADISNESEATEQPRADVPEPESSAADAASDESGKEFVDWKARAEALEKEVQALKEQAIRAQAEAQNVRRRAEMDVEKAHKFALEKFAKELLPVLDSLEKAIEAEKETGNASTPLREGVEMTLSMFLGGVQKFNLEQVDPVGQPFDPSLHEAMSMIEAPGAETNTVVAAMQKGYTLSGRLIRPAMVMVAK